MQRSVCDAYDAYTNNEKCKKEKCNQYARVPFGCKWIENNME